MDLTSMGLHMISRVATLPLAQTGTDSASNAAEAAKKATDDGRSLAEIAQDPQWWIDMFNQYGLPALKAIVLLIIAFMIAGWVKRMVYKVLTKAHLDQTLAKFFASMSRWGVLLLAFIAILSVFGINVTSFAVVLGSIGLAIGLALQGSLGNFASGLMLLIFRPFKVGDVVQVNGITAKVEQIELFSTIVDTPDNRRIIIP
ncbi:MAG: mechanosensitive ion channel, partial [Phycisphaerales bacterium]|nr:mechanosensitive ion channel [Phycisphaerales bacterium]